MACLQRHLYMQKPRRKKASDLEKPVSDSEHSSVEEASDFLTPDERTTVLEHVKILNDEKTKQGIEFDKNLLSTLGFTSAIVVILLKEVPRSPWGYCFFGLITLFFSIAVMSILHNQRLAARVRGLERDRAHDALAWRITATEYFEGSNEKKEKLDKVISNLNQVAFTSSGSVTKAPSL